MFDLANDRIGYSELLRPELGYSLDFAVGMTYSLDLEALLGVPVSLGLLDEGDEIDLSSQLYVLEAIRKSSERIALFCNAGSIQLPGRIQSVYSLLENSVFQIKTAQKGNFHPKIWVLKYSQTGSPSYIKFLVMSRNLTFDSSIDICAALQGEIGTEESEKNRPLSDFLSFAARYAGRKKQQVLSLAEDVLKVSAFQVEDPFVDYDFFPIGIPGYAGADVPLFGQKNDLVAVSPFLSDETIQKLTKFKGPRSIITRKNAVTPAVFSAFDHVYVTKDALSDNEFGSVQDIHAKVYYTTTLHGNYLYLGSANASHNAFHKNVECLLRLTYKLYGMGYKKFCGDFIPPANCPYEELTELPETQTEDLQKKEVDKALREAVYALKRASAAEEGDRYSVVLEAKPLKAQERIMISPLQKRSMKQPLETKTCFSGLLLRELSEFYILSVEEQGKEVQAVIVKVRTDGIPKERDQEIYRSIIDTNPKFMRYLSFMLSGAISGELGDTDAFQNGELHTDAMSAGIAALDPVYEQMLRVFHQNPAKLKGISDMIRRLDPSVVGDSFREMFQQFETAAKKVHK